MTKPKTFHLTNLVLCLTFILIINLTLASTSSLIQQNCPTKPIPQKFGILTTTYIRNKSTKMINDYLQRYAESDCDVYDNIYIVWNNEETPEQLGVLKSSSKWKKNVYFMQTMENSLDFKYIVPTWAEEKVFFGMDDDFDITCDTFKRAFSDWQDFSYGQVGPLASLYARSYVFDPQSQSFTYIDQIKLNPNWNYYHFGLTGIAFISRHFLELYYSDIFELKEMRKMVVQKNNCEDLLLNFMVGYLYPQLVTQYIKVPFKSLGTTGVSTTKTHRQYRAQCITHFTQILGFNPVRYVSSKKNQTLMQKKTPLNENCLVNMKQQHFEKNFISNRAYYMYIKRITGVDSELIRGENEKLVQAKKDIEVFMKKRKEEIGKLRNEDKVDIKIQEGMGQNERKILQETEMEIHFGTEEQIQKHMSKLVKVEKTQIPQKPVSQAKNEKNPQSSLHQQVIIQKKLQSSISQSKQIQYQLYMIIFGSVVLCILCIKKIIDSKNRKYHTVPESISTQI